MSSQFVIIEVNLQEQMPGKRVESAPYAPGRDGASGDVDIFIRVHQFVRARHSSGSCLPDVRVKNHPAFRSPSAGCAGKAHLNGKTKIRIHLQRRLHAQVPWDNPGRGSGMTPLV